MAPKKIRKATVKRKTSETDISLTLNIDGTGKGKISTGIPFFDHMLDSFSRHSLFDITLKCKGDLEVDGHHTVEDVGIVLGEGIKKVLGDKRGIKRFGSSDVPMMDALASVVLDISGRPYIRYKAKFNSRSARKVDFDLGLTEEFLHALTNSAGLDLHVDLKYGRDAHHSVEAIFKATARALGEAVSLDPRIKGVLSSKGKL